MTIRTRPIALPLVLPLVFVTLGACASGGGSGGSQEPAPATSSGGTASGAQAGTAGTTPAADQAWPIKTRQHVDLWLHGFAMLQDDTTKVPYFRRGYRDELIVARNQLNVTSPLDADRDRLRARLAANRDLVGAQFLALNFATWEDMRQALRLFVDANGDPRRANTQELANAIAVIGQYFPTAADRDWLSTFVNALDKENTAFYSGYWKGQQRNRAATLAAVDTLWQRTYYPKLRAFLGGTRQRSGELLLALPLDGEGRTISGGTRSSNTVVVTFPARPADAVQSVYVFAHEAIGAIASVVINDNVTPAERRAGLADRYSSAAAVRGGLLLLERAAPELADGYARYDLRVANVTPAGDARAALATSFPLPDLLRDAISRQIDLVLGGI
jgi:hypothetical protein